MFDAISTANNTESSTTQINSEGSASELLTILFSKEPVI